MLSPCRSLRRSSRCPLARGHPPHRARRPRHAGPALSDALTLAGALVVVIVGILVRHRLVVASTQVAAASGATYTSEPYAESVQSALGKA